jgi:hypothetical protein
LCWHGVENDESRFVTGEGEQFAGVGGHRLKVVGLGAARNR